MSERYKTMESIRHCIKYEQLGLESQEKNM